MEMLKSYFKKRQKQLKLYEIHEAGIAIQANVNKLKKRNNESENSFFIKECQTIRDYIMNDVIGSDVTVSVELVEKINGLKIIDLHDCYMLGSTLNEIHWELREQKVLELKFAPALTGLKVSMTELLTLSLICCFAFNVYVMFFNG